MTDIAVASGLLALLSMIFSDLPFLGLVYFLFARSAIDWEQWGVATGAYLIASIGGAIWRAFRSRS